MSIRQLGITGFRSLRQVVWKPGKLNVIIGSNGSGKSNLLRALALLQRAAMGELPRQMVRQGGIGTILWDGQAKEVAWTVAYDMESDVTDPGPVKLSYSLRLLQLGVSSAYRVDEEVLAYGVSGDQPRKILERRPGYTTVWDSRNNQPLAYSGTVPEDQPLLSLLVEPFGNTTGLAFRQRLLQWGIYHDLRVDPEAPIRQAAVARLERKIDADGQNLIPVLHTLYTTDRSFRQSLDSAMRAAFRDDFEELVFPPAADQQVQLRLRWKSLQKAQSAADLSDGTIRFLLLVTILANPERGGLIAIDEPETGLHPAMFPIIAEYAREASKHAQVIFTTHSPQFLDAFGANPPTTTVAQWVDGETRLSVVDGDEIKRWLKDYSLGALFRSGELEGFV